MWVSFLHRALEDFVFNDKNTKIILGWNSEGRERKSAWERMGKAPGNSHGSTGSARAWQSLAIVLPTEGAVKALHMLDFPPGFAKNFPSLPQQPSAISHMKGVLTAKSNRAVLSKTAYSPHSAQGC